MDPEKCRRGLKSLHSIAAWRPHERPELFSLLGAPQVIQRSVVGRSTPSSLLDPILDCSVLSWIFDTYPSALLDTLPVARIGTLLTNLCPPGSLSFSCLLTTLAADQRSTDEFACLADEFVLSHGWLAPPENY